MKSDWSRGTVVWWRLKHWFYAQVGLWKWRRNKQFVENSAYFVLKIELLFTMLSKFERETILKESAFWRVACLNHTVLWSVCNLIISLIDLVLHMVCISNNCCGLWSNGLRQNRETDKKHDEDCVEDGFSWLR